MPNSKPNAKPNRRPQPRYLVAEQPPERRIVIGNISPGDVNTEFAFSLARLSKYDVVNGNHLHGMVKVLGGPDIWRTRNEVVQTYLDKYADDAHWLLFLDSDMVVPLNLLERMLAGAEAAQAQMVGGLCVSTDSMGRMTYPTIYQVHPETGLTQSTFDYPDNRLYQVAATGTACLMVHRDVYREMERQAGHRWCWFESGPITTPKGTFPVSEDITFAMRATQALGVRLVVDTGLPIGHAKHGRIWMPEDCRRQASDPLTAAVIPMRDRADLTRALVDRLLTADHVDQVYVMDNGSVEPESAAFFGEARSRGVEVIACGPDVGIHHMWNEGLERAVKKLGPRSRIAFLNNDIVPQPGAVKTLARVMNDHHEFTAMSMNYDGRTADTEVVEVYDICAGRYDGTGGLAGFAFMVKSEFFSGGYRFPADMTWWFGDNDLVESVKLANALSPIQRHRVGIAVNVHVEHEGEGTAGSWTDPKYAAVLQADRDAFVTKWQAIHASLAEQSKEAS